MIIEVILSLLVILVKRPYSSFPIGPPGYCHRENLRNNIKLNWLDLIRLSFSAGSSSVVFFLAAFSHLKGDTVLGRYTGCSETCYDYLPFFFKQCVKHYEAESVSTNSSKGDFMFFFLLFLDMVMQQAHSKVNQIFNLQDNVSL